jgi:4'-phosphopantetheinyl transferase
MGPYGKLQLTDTDQSPPLQFNLTHRDDYTLYAFTRGRRVGIDLESQPPFTDAISRVSRFFTVREQRLIQSLPFTQQYAAILNCWTRKEAYVKAVGDGLVFGLKHFEVSVLPDEPAQLLEIHGSREAATVWTMQSLSVPSSYHATVVVEGQGWTLHHFQLHSDSDADSELLS